MLARAYAYGIMPPGFAADMEIAAVGRIERIGDPRETPT
jgi:hypothetical protein